MNAKYFSFRRRTIYSEAVFCVHRCGQARFRKVMILLRPLPPLLTLFNSPCSRPPTSTEDVATITGITSALISVFADNTLSPSPYPSATTDKLRCINAGSTRITFFLRPPLYYVCVSKWKEPESVVSALLPSDSMLTDDARPFRLVCTSSTSISKSSAF